MNDGGPAFPSAGFDSGMSLRDYFAAKALITVLTHPCSGDVTQAYQKVAEISYRIADAMLAQRQKEVA